MYINFINFHTYEQTNKQTHAHNHTHIIPLKTTSKGGTAREKIFREKRKRSSNEKNLKEAFSHDSNFLFNLLYLRRAGREDAQLGVSKPEAP